MHLYGIDIKANLPKFQLCVGGLFSKFCAYQANTKKQSNFPKIFLPYGSKNVANCSAGN